MACDTSVLLAKRLADLAPGDLDHVFFASDGSSAIEVALKMAFQYWQQCERRQPKKTRFIALGEAYHGDTIGSASVGGIARFHALFEPLLFDVIRAPIPDPRGLSATTTPAAATQYFVKAMDDLLNSHHDEVAAVIIEPLVQCAAGMVIHPPGYLHGLRELTRRYDVLLIADEVAVGMGRTGTMFACEHEQVVPDMLCLGKGLTGGYLPLSVTIANSRIYTAFLGTHTEGRALYHGHTYGGNPLAAAAALATLDVFEEEQTLKNLEPKIAYLGEHLGRLAEHPHVCSVRQRGLIGALDLTPEKSTGVPYAASERCAWRICRETLKNGVWLRPLGDILYVMPPLAISLPQLDHLMNSLGAAIEKICNEP
jgi:adenosylmethionine-8-amino-7-oxononanoate aminotransferase